MRPLSKCGLKSTTRRSASGSTPRTITPDELVAVDQHALLFDVRRRAHHARESAASFSRSGRQLRIRPSSPEIVACAVRLKMRVRSTSSKPFITDRTTISTATPSASPNMAMPAIKDREPRLGDARRYRNPTNPSYQYAHHSYRSASAGWVRAACNAGYTVATSVRSSAALPILTTSPGCTSLGSPDM